MDPHTDSPEELETAPAAPSGPPTITLGKLTATLEEPPALLAIALGRTREEIDRGGYAQTLAYGAAALAACWPTSTTWPARPRPRRWRPGQDMGEHGFEVYEALRSATKGTVSRRVLDAACIEAHNYAVGSGLTEEEIREAEGFFAPAEGG